MMADPLYELLLPHFGSSEASSRPLASDATTTSYLNRLTALSLPDLTNSEPGSLTQSSQSLLRSIQALSQRSYKSIISSATHLSGLSSDLEDLASLSRSLDEAIPSLETSASRFAEKYRKYNDPSNQILAERRNALLLAQNVDRISSILDLPTLLSSVISSSQPTGSSGSSIATAADASSSSSMSSSVSSNANYASALDLHSHIKRLAMLYPDSPLVASIAAQSEREMRLLTTNLITGLRSQSIKLAGAMRTIGWLRRVAPELDEQLQLQRLQSSKASNLPATATTAPSMSTYASSDGALGALLLACRLASLEAMLDALDPLRDLADQESAQRVEAAKKKAKKKQVAASASATASSKRNSITSKSRRDSSALDENWAGGHQTERYLKRYIEIFREQSFAIVSMYKSIFPSALPVPLGHEGHEPPSSFNSGTVNTLRDSDDAKASLLPLPSPLASFPAHLVDTLFGTLKTYLPNVRDNAARESLMTQVLYCAGSLGRLGGDFSMMLALLDEDQDERTEDQLEDDSSVGPQQSETPSADWVDVMKKHRVQASRLELLASGVGPAKPAAPRDPTSSNAAT